MQDRLFVGELHDGLNAGIQQPAKIATIPGVAQPDEMG
jgi:hypothetical protein